MTKELYGKIADLLLAGVDMQPGDKIGLLLEPDTREAGIVLLEEAYRRGAAYVHPYYYDPATMAGSMAGTQPTFEFPGFVKAMADEMAGPGWKKIGIMSESQPDAFANVSPERFGGYMAAYRTTMKNLRDAQMGSVIPWSLTYLPSRAMAKKAFPDLSPEEGVAEYWKLVISIMGLDRDDPVAWWKNKIDAARRRCDYLTGLDIDVIRFKGPGTDLTVGIPPTARWIGGDEPTVDGKIRFLPNIPTDEIFTGPDWRRTSGRVALTKPFVMHQNLGAIPQGAWFEFKDGKVVDYGAEVGKESLDALFAQDERGKYLGEIALVDPQSPFAKPGITYYNGLYDENAACHVALGAAYPTTMKEPAGQSEEELLAMGYNVAKVHEDMMIGSEQVDVTAALRDGSEIAIIKDGTFAI